MKYIVTLLLLLMLSNVVYAKVVNFTFNTEITLATVALSETRISEMVEPGDYLRFWIQSPGGSVSGSIAMYDYLIRLRKDGVKVDTIATGICASGAVIILQAGETRYVTPFSMLLVHGCHMESTGNWFKDKWIAWSERCVKRYIDNIIADLYIVKTKLPRAVIEKIMSKDTWFYAVDFKEFGFADKLYMEL